MTRRWDDDDDLLVDLTEAARGLAPLAEVVAERGRGAYTWRTVDDDLLLAPLTFDSSLDGTAVRSADQVPLRRLQFRAEPISVDLEVMADRTLGWILPATAIDLVIETADGEVHRATADDMGFFVVPHPIRGPVRLRCDVERCRFTTVWVNL